MISGGGVCSTHPSSSSNCGPDVLKHGGDCCCQVMVGKTGFVFGANGTGFACLDATARNTSTDFLAEFKHMAAGLLRNFLLATQRRAARETHRARTTRVSMCKKWLQPPSYVAYTSPRKYHAKLQLNRVDSNRRTFDD